MYSIIHAHEFAEYTYIYTWIRKFIPLSLHAVNILAESYHTTTRVVYIHTCRQLVHTPDCSVGMTSVSKPQENQRTQGLKRYHVLLIIYNTTKRNRHASQGHRHLESVTGAVPEVAIDMTSRLAYCQWLPIRLNEFCTEIITPHAS